MNILRMCGMPCNRDILHDPNTHTTHGLALTHILPLSKEIQKLGHSVSCYAGEGLRKPLYEKVQGIDVFRTRFPQRPLHLPYSFSLAKNLPRIERKIGKIEVIHAHNPAYAYAFAFSPPMPPKPLAITVHGKFPYNSIEEVIIRKLGQRAHFIAISEPTIEELLSLGVPRKRIDLIHTGVAPQKVPSRKRNFILFVGRFVWWKNPLPLVDAFKKITQKFPDISLVLIGQGPLKDTLKKRVKEHDLENNVRFTGPLPYAKVQEYYANAYFTVVPNLEESFSKTILESLVQETPVIATDNPDVPEKIKPCGVFYDHRQATNPCLIAEKMELLLQDSNLRTTLGKRGRNVVKKHFSWKAAAQKNLQVYDKLLA